jgi:peptidoglycan/xylan/chitin deacetylase (PgdA/CDA1 family)
VLELSHRALGLPLDVLRTFGIGRSNRLRVLLYHDVSPDLADAFHSQINELGERWNFISLERFEAMVLGEEAIKGSNLLLTFDDGFASNRIVAEQVLNPKKIPAVFFVVLDFINLTQPQAVRDFVEKNLFRDIAGFEARPGMKNLDWTDLEALLEQGHKIAAHTKSHLRLSDVTSDQILQDEIVTSADLLAKRLGTRIDHFAFPFGNLASMNREAMKVARRRFRFIFSCLRGDNATMPPPYSLRRESIGAEFSQPLVEALIDGFADFHYAASRAKLDSFD